MLLLLCIEKVTVLKELNSNALFEHCHVSRHSSQSSHHADLLRISCEEGLFNEPKNLILSQAMPCLLEMGVTGSRQQTDGTRRLHATFTSCYLAPGSCHCTGTEIYQTSRWTKVCIIRGASLAYNFMETEHMLQLWAVEQMLDSDRHTPCQGRKGVQAFLAVFQASIRDRRCVWDRTSDISNMTVFSRVLS